MFATFDQIQVIQPEWNPLFVAAGLRAHFLGRGEELQILRGGEREFSISLNSRRFIRELPKRDEYEVAVAFGHTKRAGQSLRTSLGGSFDALSKDEDIASLKLPSVMIPTSLVFVHNLVSGERAVFGFQFIGGGPAREIAVDLKGIEMLELSKFKEFCEQRLGIPRS